MILVIIVNVEHQVIIDFYLSYEIIVDTVTTELIFALE